MVRKLFYGFDSVDSGRGGMTWGQVGLRECAFVGYDPQKPASHYLPCALLGGRFVNQFYPLPERRAEPWYLPPPHQRFPANGCID